MWQEFLGWVMILMTALFGSGEVVRPTSTPAPLATTSTVAVVEYVIDGDTIVLEGGERVRLLGIDTPERGECFAAEASDFVRQWLTGQSVRLESDVTDRDTYERLLRHVFVPATSTAPVHVNAVLVADGFAAVLPIPPDRQYRSEFARLEAAAQEAARGRWGVCAEG